MCSLLQCVFRVMYMHSQCGSVFYQCFLSSITTFLRDVRTDRRRAVLSYVFLTERAARDVKRRRTAE